MNPGLAETTLTDPIIEAGTPVRPRISSSISVPTNTAGTSLIIERLGLVDYMPTWKQMRETTH